MAKTTILLIDIYHTTFLIYMPTITLEEEALIQRALQGVRDDKFPNIAVAARHYGCNYDVIYARAKGIQGNWLRGGKNKRLIGEEEVTLV
jgi:hypothetical protein